MMVQHTEAPYHVRRSITEKAKAHFKELRDVTINAVVGATNYKQKILEDKFDTMVDEKLGWKNGEQYDE